jgi:hypothetical protein
VLMQAPSKDLLADPELATLFFGGALAAPAVEGEDELVCET